MSKLQSFRAGGLGQRLDPAVIREAAAVEDDRFEPLLLQARGHHLADRLGGRQVAARLHAAPLVEGAGLYERRPLVVVDRLRVDMVQAAEHRQARPLLRATDARADPGPAPL